MSHTYGSMGPLGSVISFASLYANMRNVDDMSRQRSVPTDCPQRERRGWLGDAQLATETNLYNFGMAGAYTSFVQQIDDAQHTPSTMAKWFNATPGSLPDTVPFYGQLKQE